MKIIGILRRIDDLGRVVVPKAVRRMLDIGEGDPLEFYVDGGNIILKKYAPEGLNELETTPKTLVDLDLDLEEIPQKLLDAIADLKG